MAKKRTDYTRAELREITPKEKLFAIAKGMGADVAKSKPRDEIEKAILKRQRQLAKQAEREEAERAAAEEEERFNGGEEASSEDEKDDHQDDDQDDDQGGDDEDEPDDMIDDDDDLDDGLDDEPEPEAPAPAPARMATATTVSAPREARLDKLRAAQADKEAGRGALPGRSRGPAASRPASLVRSPKPRRRTPG